MGRKKLIAPFGSLSLVSAQTHSKTPKASFCGFWWAAAKLTSYVWNLATQWDLTQSSAPRENFPNGGEKRVATGLTWPGAVLSSVGLWTLTDGVGWLFAPLSSSALEAEGLWSCGMKSRSAPFVISLFSMKMYAHIYGNWSTHLSISTWHESGSVSLEDQVQWQDEQVVRKTHLVSPQDLIIIHVPAWTNPVTL